MKGTVNRNKNVTYVDAYDDNAIQILTQAIFNCVISIKDEYDEIVILCIGTDRATGDCLGPLVGQSLSRYYVENENITIFGSLDKPVHAKNLINAVEEIYLNDKRPLVIAVDAALGKTDCHVGYLSVGVGSVCPGSALNRDLPEVGDIFLTGIVNQGGSEDDMETIQNTRLNIVMKMAGIIIVSLKNSIEMVIEGLYEAGNRAI